MKDLLFDENTFEHTRLFLEILTRYDIHHSPPIVVLQSLSDFDRGFKRMVPLPVDQLEGYISTLWENNQEGFYTNAALHEMVADDEGKIRRKRNNVGRIRGQLVDVDQYLPPETIEQLIDHFKPTMVVASSISSDGLAKTHFYFLYGPEFADEDEWLFENYDALQLALAYSFQAAVPELKVDEQIISPVCAFRMPGLYHQKNPANPNLTRVLYYDDDAYLPFGVPFDFTQADLDAAREKYAEGRKKKRQQHTETAARKTGGTNDRTISQYPGGESGDRNKTLYDFTYHRLFLEKSLTKHEALGAALYENHANNVPPLSEEEVVSIVESAYHNWEDTIDPKLLARIRHTDSQSARQLLFGDIANTRKKRSEKEKDGNYNPHEDKEAGYDYSDRVRFTSLISDVSIVARVGQKHGRNLLCNEDLGVYVYDESSGCWCRGESLVPGYCMDVISEMVHDTALLGYFLDSRGLFSQKQYENFFKESYSITKLQKLTQGVHFLPELAFEADDLDGYLDHINCKNGVIDLKTGELLPHDPVYKMTRTLNATLQSIPPLLETRDDWKNAGLWEKTVYEVMNGDVEMCQFMQRLLGYTLSGHNEQQILAFFYGSGSNGKSIVMETLAHLFGNYHAPIRAEYLMMDKHSSSPGKLDSFAKLRGCRLTTTSEIEEGQKWSEGTLKDMTGNDTIEAKFMGKGNFKYTLQATLLIRGNLLPDISGTDEASWRRFLTVGFDRKFLAEEKDLKLGEKLRDESVINGILGWLVRGALQYNKLGLREPMKVLQLKADYRAEMNPLSDFFEECFEPTELEYGCTADDVARVYQAWSKENDGAYIDRSELVQKLKMQGIKKGALLKEDGRVSRKYPLAVREAWKSALNRPVHQKVTGIFSRG